jgi:hypothetical protein
MQRASRTAVIGAVHDGDSGIYPGSAYVFTRDGMGTWSQQAMLTADDGEADNRFGGSVSLDGDTAVVGAYGDDDAGLESGSAYVFIRDAGGTWTQQAKLTASDAEAGDMFGLFVSVKGDTAMVGASEADDQAGAGYVFERDGGGRWNQQAKLTAADAAVGDGFGPVSLDGDTAIIGALGDDDIGGIDQGAAYVFTRGAGGSWSQQAKLTAADAAGGERFGYGVSLDGDTVVIGAYFDDHAGDTSGSAYVFTRGAGGTWTEQAKLTAGDAAAGDEFGRYVSLDGDTALIAAFHDGDAGVESGSVYVFVRDATGSWSQQAKLTATDAAAGDEFGCSVAVSRGVALVGARSDDNVTGSAYIFTGAPIGHLFADGFESSDTSAWSVSVQ